MREQAEQWLAGIGGELLAGSGLRGVVVLGFMESFRE
jgi:hypothetical protein